MEVAYVVPGELPGPSGGTHYNEAVITALRGLGHLVDVRPIPGRWPRPRAADREALSRAMHASGTLLVDGIIALAAPECVEEAVARGTSVHLLVHSLLTADPSLGVDEKKAFVVSERAALHAASSVSCASRWSAHDVLSRHTGVVAKVAEPGCDMAEPANGSTPPQFLVLAALTPLKNQSAILRVLRDLLDLPWTLQLVGSDTVDPVYAAELHRLAGSLPADRLAFRGALTGAELDAVWQATDLLLLASTSETYAMVVTEALARGIPAVVPSGTGATEALRGASPAASSHPPGAIVDACDDSALRHAVRSWLISADVRHAWKAAAMERRTTLTSWTETARCLLGIIHG